MGKDIPRCDSDTVPESTTQHETEEDDSEISLIKSCSTLPGIEKKTKRKQPLHTRLNELKYRLFFYIGTCIEKSFSLPIIYALLLFLSSVYIRYFNWDEFNEWTPKNDDGLNLTDRYNIANLITYKEGNLQNDLQLHKKFMKAALSTSVDHFGTNWNYSHLCYKQGKMGGDWIDDSNLQPSAIDLVNLVKPCKMISPLNCFRDGSQLLVSDKIVSVDFSWDIFMNKSMSELIQIWRLKKKRQGYAVFDILKERYAPMKMINEIRNDDEAKKILNHECILWDGNKQNDFEVQSPKTLQSRLFFESPSTLYLKNRKNDRFPKSIDMDEFNSHRVRKRKHWSRDEAAEVMRKWMGQLTKNLNNLDEDTKVGFDTPIHVELKNKKITEITKILLLVGLISVPIGSVMGFNYSDYIRYWAVFIFMAMACSLTYSSFYISWSLIVVKKSLERKISRLNVLLSHVGPPILMFYSNLLVVYLFNIFGEVSSRKSAVSVADILVPLGPIITQIFLILFIITNAFSQLSVIDGLADELLTIFIVFFFVFLFVLPKSLLVLTKCIKRHAVRNHNWISSCSTKVKNILVDMVRVACAIVALMPFLVGGVTWYKYGMVTGISREGFYPRNSLHFIGSLANEDEYQYIESAAVIFPSNPGEIEISPELFNYIQAVRQNVSEFGKNICRNSNCRIEHQPHWIDDLNTFLEENKPVRDEWSTHRVAKCCKDVHRRKVDYSQKILNYLQCNMTRSRLRRPTKYYKTYFYAWLNVNRVKLTIDDTFNVKVTRLDYEQNNFKNSRKRIKCRGEEMLEQKRERVTIQKLTLPFYFVNFTTQDETRYMQNIEAQNTKRSKDNKSSKFDTQITGGESVNQHNHFELKTRHLIMICACFAGISLVSIINFNMRITLLMAPTWLVTFLQVFFSWITLGYRINDYFLCANMMGSVISITHLLFESLECFDGYDLLRVLLNSSLAPLVYMQCVKFDMISRYFGTCILLCNVFSVVNGLLLKGFCRLSIPHIKIQWIRPRPLAKSFQLDLDGNDRAVISQNTFQY